MKFDDIKKLHQKKFREELQHFIGCVRNDLTPVTTGEDGRAVLEMLNAAYHSARIGRKVSLPFRPKTSKPVDLWLGQAIEPAS